MSSVINKELQAIQSLQAKVKDVFNGDIMQRSSFAKELYKQVRNNSKKIDDIIVIEGKLKQKIKINEEQTEKLRNKDSYLQTMRI